MQTNRMIVNDTKDWHGMHLGWRGVLKENKCVIMDSERFEERVWGWVLLLGYWTLVYNNQLLEILVGRNTNRRYVALIGR